VHDNLWGRAVDLDTFIVAVFCAIEEEPHDLAERERWRTRGPRPRLADSEVLTMEVVGEYLGIDTDRGLYDYFRRYYGAWFPALRRVHRTAFARQAANLSAGWCSRARNFWARSLSPPASDLASWLARSTR
jgi:hypothetical protein